MRGSSTKRKRGKRRGRRGEKKKVDSRVFQSELTPSNSGAEEIEPHVAVTVGDVEEAEPSAGVPPSTPNIAGRYRLDERLAEGGMGIVYSGWHVTLDQPVAVKVIRKELVNNADAVQRFIEEARALAQLRGAHVAQVLDAGIEDGSPFIVMELLQGQDLRTLLMQTQDIAPGYAVRLVREACEAVAEAHAKGIVHRDIKPENLFLAEAEDGSRTLKVIDFGISARQGADGSYDAQALGPGSPEYMSPEQLLPGHIVDHRADIWSLGVVLYELLTGSVPFTGETQHDICTGVVAGEPPPVVGRGYQVPPELVPVIMKCLSKPAQERFMSALELAAALRPFETQLESEPPAPLLTPRPSLGPSVERASLVTTEANVSQLPSRRLLWGVAAGVVLGVGVYFLVRSGAPGISYTAPVSTSQQGVVSTPALKGPSGPEVVPVTEGPSVTPFVGEEVRTASPQTVVAPRWRRPVVPPAAVQPKETGTDEKLDEELEAIGKAATPVVSSAPTSEEQAVEARYALAEKKASGETNPEADNPYKVKPKAPASPATGEPNKGEVPSTKAFPEVYR